MGTSIAQIPPNQFSTLVPLASDGDLIDSTISDGAPQFHPPSLVVANIVAYSIIVTAAIVLVVFAVRGLFHARTRILAAGAALALIVTMIAYALDIAILVINYDLLDSLLPTNTLTQIQSAEIFFACLKDPTTFAAATLVIRYFCRGNPSPFIARACFSFVVIMVFIGIRAGINASHEDSRKLIFIEFERTTFTTVGNVPFLVPFFQMLVCHFLSVWVERRTKNDRRTSLTLLIVIRLLGLYPLAGFIFEMVITHLPSSLAGDVQVVNALNLSTTTVFGVVHIVVMSALLFLIRLWGSRIEAVPHIPEKGATEDTCMA